jgi:hypothetical protein
MEGGTIHYRDSGSGKGDVELAQGVSSVAVKVAVKMLMYQQGIFEHVKEI